MAVSQNVQYTKMCSPQKKESPCFFYVGLSRSYSYEFLRFKRLMDKFQLKLSLFAQAGNRAVARWGLDKLPTSETCESREPSVKINKKQVKTANLHIKKLSTHYTDSG